MGPRVAAFPTGFDNFLFVADNLGFDVKAFVSISLEVFFDRPVRTRQVRVLFWKYCRRELSSQVLSRNTGT
jgi:hypothetical protein